MYVRALCTFLALTLLSPPLSAQTPAPIPATHRDLDWDAPSRWVHIDNIDPELESIFVAARHQWLKDLTQGDSLLGDGRPLFWHAFTDSTCTYYTFYPFRVWADLDTRGAMATQTTQLVGKTKLQAYDAGDSALVPPHGSQLWRRVASADIVASGGDSLTELTAGFGRMEFHLVDWSNWDQYEKAYAEFRAALIAQSYPLVCRVFSNSYGGRQGEYLLWWLARDPSTFAAAPSLRATLAEGLGKEKADSLLMSLERYFPVQSSSVAERRNDMSNLGHSR